MDLRRLDRIAVSGGCLGDDTAPTLVTDHIIHVRTNNGTSAVGLHEALALVQTGGLIDLPGMRADQRAPVVTALAILSTTLRRYSRHELTTADRWLNALRDQLGDDALVLAGGPDDRPQFLQPVLIGMGDPKPLSLTEVDHLMPATQHALKSQMEGTPEAALFALFASTWRQSSSPSQPAGARSRSLTVLVGDGVMVGSEIVSLTSAYDSMVPSVVGSDAPAATRARDHMLSAQPWTTEQPTSTIPYPFIDCRRVRLVPAGNALVGAVLVSGSGARVLLLVPATSRIRTLPFRLR